MISVLIPVYNWNVYELVKTLSRQLTDHSIAGEIMVYDDFSKELFKNQNRKINGMEHVIYRESNANSGRIAIRKRLANDARYEWLLFIDCDSSIINNLYLQSYVKAIGNNCDVYSGGRKYHSASPTDCNKRLHWKYGMKRESQKGSRTVLHVNNFCIRKKLFLALNFPFQLQGYGHEDTWLQVELEREKKRIAFIDNPVQHDGLEDIDLFLEKTKNALKNLLALAHLFHEHEVRRINGLYHLFCWQKELGLTRVTASILSKRIKNIETNLRSCNPSLLQFDFYRLYHLIKLAQEFPIKKADKLK